MHDLNPFILEILPAGFTAGNSQAYGINDHGQIIAYAQILDHGAHVATRSFLLTPVPLPAAAFLLAPALGSLGLMRRRAS